jgi:uncharacterized protein YggE
MRTLTKLARPIVLSLAAASSMTTASLLHAAETSRTIEVSGEGKVSSAPDLATITAGVTTQAPAAQEALAQNNAAMEQVVQTLRDRGIGPKDIQTSQFNVSPVYEQQDRNRQEAPKLVAYRVTNQVTVKVRKIAEVGGTLDALVQAGGNQISGIDFQVDDPAKLLEEARANAVRDARRRAETLAQAGEVELGAVIRIQELGVGFPRPVQFRGRQMAFAGGDAVPIESGEQDFTVNVNVTFEIAGNAGAK